MTTLYDKSISFGCGGGKFAAMILPGTPMYFGERKDDPNVMHWDKSSPPERWPWGTYGKDACHELRWTTLGNCCNDHLEAILFRMHHIPQEYRGGIIGILNKRRAGLADAPPLTIADPARPLYESF